MEKFEFWFRKEYEDLLREQKLVQFVRPGVRQSPEPKGTSLGENVLIRFLDIPGTEKTDPVLNPYQAQAVVTKLEIKKIKEMNEEDFVGTSTDTSSQLGVIAQLERIYKKPFTPEDIVTVFAIKYLS